jgi:hypothetical protein
VIARLVAESPLFLMLRVVDVVEGEAREQIHALNLL